MIFRPRLKCFQIRGNTYLEYRWTTVRYTFGKVHMRTIRTRSQRRKIHQRHVLKNQHLKKKPCSTLAKWSTRRIAPHTLSEEGSSIGGHVLEDLIRDGPAVAKEVVVSAHGLGQAEHLEHVRVGLAVPDAGPGKQDDPGNELVAITRFFQTY